MYTVLRFLDRHGGGGLEDLVAMLNQACPGLYSGMDRVPCRFSCSLCTDNNWQAHRQAIFDTVAKCAEAIKKANDAHVNVDLDLAVNPEDYHNSFIVEISFDKEFLGLLNMHMIGIVVTVYGSAIDTLGTRQVPPV